MMFILSLFNLLFCALRFCVVPNLLFFDYLQNVLQMCLMMISWVLAVDL